MCRIFGVFDLSTPAYCVRDPKLLKQITVTDFDYFIDHRSYIANDMDDVFGKTLFMLKGGKWRETRAKLSPAFTGSKLRRMFALVSECSTAASDFLLKEVAHNQKLEYKMEAFFSNYTADVITSCAFGCKFNSFENLENHFYLMRKKYLNKKGFGKALKLLMLRFVPSAMKIFNVQYLAEDFKNCFKKFIFSVMDYRLENDIFRPDMIHLLLAMRKQQANENGNEEIQKGCQLDDNEIAGVCLEFFLAGYNTTSAALVFTAYELAMNPKIQSRLYREIVELDKSIDGKTLEYDNLKELKFMDQVICESLRKWPPVTMTDRLCVRDYRINDEHKEIVIKKGYSIWIPIYAIHHDSKYFPQPNQFNPDRFSEANRDCFDSDTFLSFGLGLRKCIGMKFAIMEIKSIFYKLLLNFRIETNENTQHPVKAKKQPVFLESEQGVSLSFIRRNIQQ